MPGIVELRLPEVVHVRLVADDVILDRREALRDVRHPRGELRRRAGCREVPRALRRDGEDDPDTGGLCHRQPGLDLALARDHVWRGCVPRERSAILG